MCYNCQKQSYLVLICKKAAVFGNCAKTEYYNQECLALTPKCLKFRNNYHVKDHLLNASAEVLNSQSSLVHII